MHLQWYDSLLRFPRMAHSPSPDSRPEPPEIDDCIRDSKNISLADRKKNKLDSTSLEMQCCPAAWLYAVLRRPLLNERCAHGIKWLCGANMTVHSLVNNGEIKPCSGWPQSFISHKVRMFTGTRAELRGGVIAQLRWRQFSIWYWISEPATDCLSQLHHH